MTKSEAHAAWNRLLTQLEDTSPGDADRCADLCARLAEHWCLNLAPHLGEQEFQVESGRWRTLMERE